MGGDFVSHFLFYLKETQMMSKCKIQIPQKWRQCPNLMNLSRILNPPKTGFNWAPAFETMNTIFSGTNHIWAAV